MRRLPFSFALAALTSCFALPAWADKVAVLPFTSPTNVPRVELDKVRRWTREAVTKRGHGSASDAEMVSAEAAVKDGVADTSQEYVAAGKAAGAEWALSGRVDHLDHPPTKLPDGREEEGFTTYRVELEAAQVGTGRVESLSREVLPDEGPSDIAEMIGLLVRPEGIAGAAIPWEHVGVRRPSPRPKPAQLPSPPQADRSGAPPPPRLVYGNGRPFAIGASIGVTTALVRPEQARGPSSGMPIGATVGYAVVEQVPGLEWRGNITSQAIGPRAIELSAGARYAFTPISGVRLFVGPELLLGAHVALGADKAARFLTRGSAFVALGVTDGLQLEIAGDLAAALGGSGTLVLGGGTTRIVLRF